VLAKFGFGLGLDCGLGRGADVEWPTGEPKISGSLFASPSPPAALAVCVALSCGRARRRRIFLFGFLVPGGSIVTILPVSVASPAAGSCFPFPGTRQDQDLRTSRRGPLRNKLRRLVLGHLRRLLFPVLAFLRPLLSESPAFARLRIGVRESDEREGARRVLVSSPLRVPSPGEVN